MGTGTYPNKEVIQFVNEHVIPLQIPADHVPLSTDYRCEWTPCLLILDQNGKEHYRGIGFFPPLEFMPFVLLGLAWVDFNTRDYESAITRLEIVEKTYPASGAAPEAVYLLGVSRFKSTNDVSWLKWLEKKISQEYPTSEWVTRASPYTLIK